MVKSCIVCGNNFKMYQKAGYNYIGKTCSRECFFKSRVNNISLNCNYCNKQFDIKPYQYRARKNKETLCCSRECAFANKKDKPWLYQRNPIPKEQHKTIVSTYLNDKKTIADIAHINDVSRDQVRRILLNNDVELRQKKDYITIFKSFTVIAKRLRVERGDKCQICGWDKANCDVHHIIERSKGGSNEKENLIVLCPNCHRLAHKKKIQLPKKGT